MRTLEICYDFYHIREQVVSIFQIVEEAGGAVTRMDGGKFSVFDRSVLVSNGVVHDKVMFTIQTPTHRSDIGLCHNL